jgi:hypothetical protein
MKWRFGSVKEKTRRFEEDAFGRNERSSEEKIRKAVFWGRGGGKIFGNIVRSEGVL